MTIKNAGYKRSAKMRSELAQLTKVSM